VKRRNDMLPKTSILQPFKIAKDDGIAQTVRKQREDEPFLRIYGPNLINTKYFLQHEDRLEHGIRRQRNSGLGVIVRISILTTRAY
jgi:hypothetical protein